MEAAREGIRVFAAAAGDGVTLEAERGRLGVSRQPVRRRRGQDYAAAFGEGGGFWVERVRRVHGAGGAHRRAMDEFVAAQIRGTRRGADERARHERVHRRGCGGTNGMRRRGRRAEDVRREDEAGRRLAAKK